MSQITKLLTSAGPIPPIIATSYQTQDGTAVPAANILIVNGFDSTENNLNGIITKGGVAGTGTANEVDVVITNRLQGVGSTVGAVTTNLVTFNLGATPATFVIDANICGFNAATPAGAGYSLFGTVRTDGATASLVGTPDKITNEDAAMTTCDSNITVAGNTVIISSTGAVGLTINWSAVATYVTVS